ncbi:MAG TPA: bifunctional metallophosphatase/5'-nucleotidase [Candidatus Scatavimonas merdigallinarum]|uniref:Bifunctional metallophosphatase/5'-nucleotidase n=1 Tax=Candidatus Scatavimonas merdigallinarum TaxID=2840914 RepID=A0A9D0ZG76_9FIRM|nr:bifunctional metallophosphatase/5'-nucleotidase [Candidatus Scatavimonas merdigallinarum]
MKKVLSLLLCLMLVCTAFCLQVTAADDGTVTITVAHTNDIHARNSYDEYNQTIGFPKAKTIVDTIGADLLLDAGDLFHGQAFATIENGESIAQLVNALGYDAMTPGNHDWNYGQAQLKRLEELSGMPIMAGNVLKDGSEKFFDTDYIIKEIDGVKVGVFGVIDPAVYGATNPSLMQGIEYTDIYAYANKMVEQLEQEQCAVIICLSHCVDHEKFASTVNGVDLLICGHLHIELQEEINGTLIVEAGEYMRNIGQVDLVYSKDTDTIVKKEAKLITFKDAALYQEDPQILSLLTQINDRQTVILDEIVGSTPVLLDGEKSQVRTQETNLGRVVTDTYLYETGADVAIENGGGIRSSIQQGEITKRDIINVAPFGNIIVTKQISGKDLLDTLELSVDLGIRTAAAFAGTSTEWPENDGSYLQFGGITAEFDEEKPFGSRVSSVTVGGEPIDLEKMYTVAGNNYIMEDSDYPAIAQAEKISEYTTCDDALTKFISNVGVEGSIDAVRLTNITGRQPTQPQEDPTQPQSEPATELSTQAATTSDSSAVHSQEPSSQAQSGKETQSAGKGAAATGDQTAVFLPLLALIGAAAAVVVLKRREKA